ncbi:MAG: serine/threonine phosphatase [Leptolyngbyaceae cyanobacterium MO_188.B28]|nr:serine/threonine phosphatase [Leptolyngbyaceae cyanobacterium MO_188.B28]
MLVCPHCQFENPEHNNFCQRCGNALRVWQAVVTLNRKPQASEQQQDANGDFAQAVSFLENQVSGEAPMLDDYDLSRLKSVVKDGPVDEYPEPDPALRSLAHSPEDPEAGRSASTLSIAETQPPGKGSAPSFELSEGASQSAFKIMEKLEAGDYLDLTQRYQLTESPIGSLSETAEMEIGVLDLCPAAPSPLEKINEKLLTASTAAESLDMFVQSGLPTSAQPYLLLQHRLFPALPEIHDAWQDNDHTVLILEDRLLLPLLSDFWRENDVDPLQQVHWLYEMTELWEALAVWQGQTSLVNLENLRVDDDQILCLRRLYFQPSGSTYTLEDLGLLWQSLLQQSQDFPLDALMLLAHRLGSQEIKTIEEAQACLVKIADGLQLGEIDPAAEAEMPAAGEFEDDNSDPITNPEAVSSIPINKTPNDPISEFSFLISDGEDRNEIDYADELSQLDSDPIDEDIADSEDSTDLPTMVLPMKLVGLAEEGRTHIGRQREHNEDTFCIQTELKRQESPLGQSLHARGLYILCDGMGGHAGGEVASALAVKTLQEYFNQHWIDSLPSEEEIHEAIAQANQSIYEINQQNERSGSGRMGTTLVMALFQDTRVIVAHVGDSRLYRFSRRLGLQQVTVDHEVGQREIERGVDPSIAYARPDAYQLTQALGPRNQTEIRPSINFLDLSEDTLLILCSDGLSDNELLETYCETYIEPLLGSRSSLEEGVSQLIDLANEVNGHDNITAIASRIRVRPNLEKMKPSSAASDG